METQLPFNESNGIHIMKPVKKRRQTRKEKHDLIEKQKRLIHKIISAKEGLNFEQIARLAEIEKEKVATLLSVMKREKAVCTGDKTKTSMGWPAWTYYIVKKKSFWDRAEEFLSFKWLKK